MKHDPSTAAKVLAEIEQFDKTVFYDTPGGVIENATPKQIRAATIKNRSFKPEDIKKEIASSFTAKK